MDMDIPDERREPSVLAATCYWDQTSLHHNQRGGKPLYDKTIPVYLNYMTGCDVFVAEREAGGGRTGRRVSRKDDMLCVGKREKKSISTDT